MSWIIALLLALFTGLFGSPGGGPDGPHADGTPPPAWIVGTKLAQWGEDRTDRADLGELPYAPLLIQTEAEREAFLDGLGDGLDTTALESVDLETHVLVATAFHRCTESGSLYTDGTGRVWFAVTTGDDMTECYWAPVQLQVWSLDRGEFGEATPEISGAVHERLGFSDDGPRGRATAVHRLISA